MFFFPAGKWAHVRLNARLFEKKELMSTIEQWMFLSLVTSGSNLHFCSTNSMYSPHFPTCFLSSLTVTLQNCASPRTWALENKKQRFECGFNKKNMTVFEKKYYFLPPGTPERECRRERNFSLNKTFPDMPSPSVDLWQDPSMSASPDYSLFLISPHQNLSGTPGLAISYKMMEPGAQIVCCMESDHTRSWGQNFYATCRNVTQGRSRILRESRHVQSQTSLPLNITRGTLRACPCAKSFWIFSWISKM